MEQPLVDVRASDASGNDVPVTGVPVSGVPVTDVVALRRRYQPVLLRVAAGYVGSHALAEEVVQDTWLGAITGLPRFEARSSLKTWVFRILENVAKSTAKREARVVPVGSVEDDPDARPAAGRAETPETQLLLRELKGALAQAVAALPPRERAVLTLRAGGATAREVCDRLRISDANQRVALHRARSRLLTSLGPYLRPGGQGGHR
jgi:RNA polymerase sigma-70 factor (ECF subfamily)